MRPLLLTLVALLAAPTLGVVGQGRSVHGRVTDQRGDPLRGAVVQIKNMHNLQVRSYFTQVSGEYQFHGLHRDVDYELKAEYDRQTSKVRVLRWHDSRINVRMDLRIRPAKKAHRSSADLSTGGPWLPFACTKEIGGGPGLASVFVEREPGCLVRQAQRLTEELHGNEREFCGTRRQGT
jgi:hypothetical protein